MIEESINYRWCWFYRISFSKTTFRRKIKVVIVDNFARGVKDKALQEIEASELCSIYSLDLRSNLPDYEQFDTIFHLAAIIGVKHVLKNPLNVLKYNFQLLDNLIDFARKNRWTATDHICINQ